MHAQRTETVAVPADKIRKGDVVSLCRDFEPDTVIASAEYIGDCNTLNSVQIAFQREDGTPYFMRTPGFYTHGTFMASKHFYVTPEAAFEISGRPHAMDEFYGDRPRG